MRTGTLTFRDSLVSRDDSGRIHAATVAAPKSAWHTHMVDGGSVAHTQGDGGSVVNTHR